MAAAGVNDSGWRDLFAVPPGIAYLAGNSLGLQPIAARDAVDEELGRWAQLGIDGFFVGPRPWLTYHERLQEPLARLAGALPHEVVAMNTLTVNLHLMMASFYRPDGRRHRVLIEDAAFPSDAYAVASQVAQRGLDPATAVARVQPDDVIETLEDEGDSIALVLLGGVNYLTGELLDMAAITAAGHEAGALVGWDLAHAIGNVPLQLHDWGADFAVWCSYKYLSGGPGAIGGAFVHERHGCDPGVPRLAGWWGNDPATRFEMVPGFEPRAGAEGWQVSTTPILSLVPVLVSLELFDQIGLDVLRERSVRLTAYLESLLDEVGMHLITPRDPARRGCQLSIAVDDAAAVAQRLADEHGVVCDVRRPNVIRLAPTPLYSTADDCRRAAAALSS
jgi:kynureninase